MRPRPCPPGRPQGGPAPCGQSLSSVRASPAPLPGSSWPTTGHQPRRLSSMGTPPALPLRSLGAPVTPHHFPSPVTPGSPSLPCPRHSLSLPGPGHSLSLPGACPLCPAPASKRLSLISELISWLLHSRTASRMTPSLTWLTPAASLAGLSGRGPRGPCPRPRLVTREPPSSSAAVRSCPAPRSGGLSVLFPECW